MDVCRERRSRHWRGQAGLGKVDAMNLPVRVSCPLAVTIPCLPDCTGAEAGLVRSWIRAARGLCREAPRG